jgi:hypothetical protein
LQRLLSTTLVLGLLVATAAAFAVTEGLKLVKPPVTRTLIVSAARAGGRPHQLKAFSPTCNCPTNRAYLRFWLRRGDTLTLDVLDRERRVVATIVDSAHAHPRFNRYAWDGRTSTGRIAPDGTYRFRIHLAGQHRTILLPNELVLDTKPPLVRQATVVRDTFSPDGDGRADGVWVKYRLDGPARALLFVDGTKVVQTRFRPTRGELPWFGKLDGRALPEGTYRLRVAAVDLAGNVTPRAKQAVVPVHIRYIALARPSLTVKARTKLGIGVRTDAADYSWRLDGDSGVESARLLVVRAPKRPGVYRLVVTENGHSAHARVVVRPRR